MKNTKTKSGKEIYDRNDSDTLKELLKNTDDIPVRVEVLSNYDCINSNWLESQEGYRYKESYFGDMIDALNLNPAKVKKMLVEKGYTVYGRFPDKKYRDGKEQVSYEQFYHELINSCCGANLLTYIGKVSLQELYDAGFSLGEVIIPKGNCCVNLQLHVRRWKPPGNGTPERCQTETGSQGLSRIPLPS